MDQSLCPKCTSPFSEDNPPKQLINCSHNLCFKCLKDQIICPVDRIRIEKRKYTIQAFQTNQKLLQCINQSKMNSEKQRQKENATSRKNSKCVNEFSTPSTEKYSSQTFKIQQINQKKEVIEVQLPCVSPQKQNNTQKRLTISPKTVKLSFDTCLLHSKKADLICLQDKCLICANCGLFGQHKQHKIISYDQFLSQYSSVTQESFRVYEQIKRREEKLDSQAIQAKKEQMFKQKRDGQIKSIRTYINGFIDFLRKLQKQLIADLDIAMDFKKKKIQKSDGIRQLLTKKQQYVASIQTMSNGVDDIFNLQNIGQYIDYIDKESPHSFIINQGEYLIVEIDNFYKQRMHLIEQEVNDISFSFGLPQQEIKQTIKLISKDMIGINELIEQSKKKLLKKPNPYSKINTPSRIQPTVPNSNSVKQSTVSPNIKINNEEQQLLVGSGSKQSSKGSDNKMKKESSPIQMPSILQNDYHPFIKPYDTYLNKQEDDECIKVSEVVFNPTPRHQRTASCANQSAKNVNRLKILQINRQNQLSQSRAFKSRTKINTDRDPHVTALGQKSQNKKKKRLDLPDKYLRIYQDLQKDKVEVLDLGGAFLGENSILTISQLFTSRCKLKIVKLMNNKIGDQLFPQLLSRCKFVQSLNLSYNLLTQKSLDWLERQANHLGQLKNITLSNNKIVLRNVRERLQGLARKGIKVSL